MHEFRLLRHIVLTFDFDNPKSRPMAVSLSFLFLCNDVLHIEGDGLPFRRCTARHVCESKSAVKQFEASSQCRVTGWRCACAISQLAAAGRGNTHPATLHQSLTCCQLALSRLPPCVLFYQQSLRLPYLTAYKTHRHIRCTPNLAGNIQGKKVFSVLVYFSIVLLWQAIITLQKIAIETKAPYIQQKILLSWYALIINKLTTWQFSTNDNGVGHQTRPGVYYLNSWYAVSTVILYDISFQYGQ